MTLVLSDIVDTHAHLSDSVFDDDRLEVIKRARAVGVSSVVTVSEDMSDARRNLDLAKIHSELRPAAGLYPTNLDLNEADQMIAFIRMECASLIGIGEVGLDHWVVKSEEDQEIQREIYSRFVDLSLELDLPLNVHSRSAGRHAVALLLNRGAKKVQLHAFDGKASAALPAVEAGYFFSIPPSIVRSRQKQKLVKQLPLTSILLETDSPVLGPTAQERNEPANILVALEAIAEIKGINEEVVVQAIRANVRRLYGDVNT